MKRKIFTLLLSLFTIGLFAQAPIAEYHFADGSLEDSSISEFDLNAIGTVIPTEDRFGDQNQAIFIRDGGVDVGDAEVLNMDEPITISSWVKVDSFNGEWTAVINKWNAEPGSYYLGINPNNLRMRWNVFVANVEDTEPIEIGVWTHYAAMYDGQSLKIFRNGDLVNSNVVGEIYGRNDLPLRIGVQSNFPVTNFIGNVDDVYVYKAALSDNQIKQLSEGVLGSPDRDMGIIDLSMSKVQLGGAQTQVAGKLYNYGKEVINSLELKVEKAGAEQILNFDNLNLAQLEPFIFDENVDLELLIGEESDLTISIEKVNGSQDDVSDNNSRTEGVRGLAFFPKRKMVIEEGTGTWCTWCPRGAVALDELTSKYPDDFIGIAVHNRDPMTLAEYDDSIRFVTFPSCHVDRALLGASINPEAAEGYYVERVKNPDNTPLANISHTTSFDGTSLELKIETTIESAINFDGDYRLLAVVTEDGVTGTSSGYAQINAYAGGANGPMGGYENLPSPVPADQMVYDHVARILIGGYNGIPGLLPSFLEHSNPVTANLSALIPDSLNFEKLKVITMLLSPEGEIINATSSNLLDGDVTRTKDIYSDTYVKVFPNPTHDNANIEIDLKELIDVSLTITDINGKVVAAKDYGKLVGKNILPVYPDASWSGFYFLKINIGDQFITRKLMVK